ncbi:hypothetical protein MASSI9I_50595 [Massilia sp. 9I]|nr:hypothetical protein MASSI9I_50595 [Massilia sp. 9I]
MKAAGARRRRAMTVISASRKEWLEVSREHWLDPAIVFEPELSRVPRHYLVFVKATPRIRVGRSPAPLPY